VASLAWHLSDRTSDESNHIAAMTSFTGPLFGFLLTGNYLLFWPIYRLLHPRKTQRREALFKLFFGSDDPASRWQRFGRTTLFIASVLFAMLLAVIGGRNIALMEFDHGLHPVP